jgi:hypothetical protein
MFHPMIQNLNKTILKGFISRMKPNLKLKITKHFIGGEILKIID